MSHKLSGEQRISIFVNP